MALEASALALGFPMSLAFIVGTRHHFQLTKTPRSCETGLAMLLRISCLRLIYDPFVEGE